MDMSAAALPPIQPHISDADRAHPLFAEYRQHRSFCDRQMIDAPRFSDWLYQREQGQMRDHWAKHPSYPDFLQWMRDNKGGARGTLTFPENFKFWLGGGRW